MLNDLAASNKPIVNDFKPLEGGFIKNGSFGVVYKGMQYAANPIKACVWYRIELIEKNMYCIHRYTNFG